MPERVRGRARMLRWPKARRTGEAAVFFPGEAVRILEQGAARLDYAQFRRLLTIVRTFAKEPHSSSKKRSRKWSRITFQELVAIRNLLKVVHRSTTGRLYTKQAQRLCRKLRRHFANVENPLLEVELRREGAVVIAQLAATQLLPATGQRQIQWVEDRTQSHLKQLVTPTHGFAQVSEDIAAASKQMASRAKPRHQVRIVI